MIIRSQVGYGVYAKKDFKKGDFILRYCGKFSKDGRLLSVSQFLSLTTIDLEEVKDRAYAIYTKMDSIVLDGKFFRNFGPLTNHSKHPNCEAIADFVKGVNDVIIIALKDIPKGSQILWDYTEEYFEGEKLNFDELADSDDFPTRIKEMNF